MRVLDALQHSERFTKEELEVLLADADSVEAARALLDSREAMARLHAPAPDVEAEWQSFARRHTARSSKRVYRIGAALLVAASLALLFLLKPTAPVGYTVFEASRVAQEITMQTHNGVHTLNIPRGMNKQLTLADGTKVWLNAESSLQYPETFEGKDQRVVYLKGEAYFEVAKDSLHPFFVKTDALETQVLGTAFNVRAYSSDDVQVTLVEGSVKVSDKHHHELRLQPGEHARLHSGNSLKAEPVEEASAYRSWADGQFYFDNTELVEIMRELGRWYNVDILFTNRDIMTDRLHFQADRTGTLSEALDLLNSMQKVKARIEDGQVIVEVR